MEKTYNLTIVTPFEDIATLMQIARKNEIIRKEKDVYVFNTVTDRYEYATSLDSAKFEQYMDDNKRDVLEGRMPTYQAKLIASFVSENIAHQIMSTVLKTRMQVLRISYAENP